VDVLEDEHRRPRLRESLEEHARRGEEILLVADDAFLEPEQVREARLGEAALLRIEEMLLDRRAKLFARARRLLVLDDARTSSHHVRERPEGDALAVGETAAGVPPNGSCETVHVLLELPREARLADAADPDDRDEVRAAVLGGRVVELLHEPELAIAAHERRLEPG
jgi:hypothetical protein